MNCFNHTDIPAVAYCRACGKALCENCKRTAQGTIYCDDHAPAAAIEGAIRQRVIDNMAQEAAGKTAPPKPTSPPVEGDVSPGLACLLGFIPGVGAIYNGQYAKGLVHAIVFGLLVSITSSGTAGDLEPLFGILIGVWVMYMALEAYHTARKRRAGEPVDEFSSILDVHGRRGGFPIGAVTLIGLGVLLLLNTMDVIQLRYMLKYWPVLLILLGAYMLYERLEASNAMRQEVGHERQ
ncbi:MAG: LiaI-LiaF-like domain-containing protein [Bryobacteraceae bacterium]